MDTIHDCTISPATSFIKDMRYNHETHDFDAYVICPDRTEIYLGSRDTSWDAAALCDTYVYEQLMQQPPLDVAADSASALLASTSPLPAPSTPRVRSSPLQNCRRFSTPPHVWERVPPISYCAS